MGAIRCSRQSTHSYLRKKSLLAQHAFVLPTRLKPLHETDVMELVMAGGTLKLRQGTVLRMQHTVAYRARLETLMS